MPDAVATADPQVAAETAMLTLVQQVRAPVFFAKLAQYGINPNTSDEQYALLKMATQIRELYNQQQQTKQAAAGNTIQFAAGMLDYQCGVPDQTPGPTNEMQGWAVKAASHPDLQAAALIYESVLQSMRA